jgi:CRISPR-associated protein Cas2
LTRHGRLRTLPQMVVAVSCDIASDDHRKAVYDLLVQYGLKRVQKTLFESTAMDESTLLRLKRDVDRATDSYDKVRFYQYPLEQTLVITSLEEKKWRKTKVKA